MTTFILYMLSEAAKTLALTGPWKRSSRLSGCISCCLRCCTTPRPSQQRGQPPRFARPPFWRTRSLKRVRRMTTGFCGSKAHNNCACVRCQLRQRMRNNFEKMSVERKISNQGKNGRGSGISDGRYRSGQRRKGVCPSSRQSRC